MNDGQLTVAPDKGRVFVTDDHRFMRKSIIEAIERDRCFTVCGQAEDAAEAFDAVMALQPDVVITDLQLKSSTGLDLIKALRARWPNLSIVATTTFDLRRSERLARAAGATAFVSKHDGPEKLIAAVHEVLDLKKRARESEAGKELCNL